MTIMSETDILRKNVADLQEQVSQAHKRILALQDEVHTAKTKNEKLEREIEMLTIDLAFYKDEIGGTGA